MEAPARATAANAIRIQRETLLLGDFFSESLGSLASRDRTASSMSTTSVSTVRAMIICLLAVPGALLPRRRALRVLHRASRTITIRQRENGECHTMLQVRTLGFR